jgi:hypothetical protein
MAEFLSGRGMVKIAMLNGGRTKYFPPQKQFPPPRFAAKTVFKKAVKYR